MLSYTISQWLFPSPSLIGHFFIIFLFKEQYKINGTTVTILCRCVDIQKNCNAAHVMLLNLYLAYNLKCGLPDCEIIWAGC